MAGHDPTRQPAAAAPEQDDRGLLALLFESIDARDTDGFLEHLTGDARFVFGNAPPAVGKAAIGAMVRGFFDSIAACRHEVADAFRDGDHVICRGNVTYTRHDGRAVTIPFCNILAMRGRRIADYQVYSDPAPLFGP